MRAETKKLLIITVIVITLILALFGKTGRCVVHENRVLFWGDDGQVLTLSPFGPLVEKSYRLLDTGDNVLVIYLGVRESYPGQTTALCCIPLWPGSINSFSESQISELIHLGWLRGRFMVNGTVYCPAPPPYGDMADNFQYAGDIQETVEETPVSDWQSDSHPVGTQVYLDPNIPDQAWINGKFLYVAVEAE